MAKLPKESDFAIESPKVKKVAPTVFLDVPASEIDSVKIGDTVTAKFRGKVVGINIHKSSNSRSRAHIDIEDPSVTVDSSDGQMADLDEELDE